MLLFVRNSAVTFNYRLHYAPVNVMMGHVKDNITYGNLLAKNVSVMLSLCLSLPPAIHAAPK